MKNKPSKTSHIDALNTVVRALEPLTTDERKKVIAAASAFLLDNISAGGTSSGGDDSSGGTELHPIEEIINKKTLRAGHTAAVVAYQLIQKSGTNKFKLDDLCKLYTNIGLIPPDRFDMTLRAAKAKGKRLFKVEGRNCYALTFNGQALGKKISCRE